MTQFLSLFVCVVGAADERSGFDMANPGALALLFEVGEFFW